MFGVVAIVELFEEAAKGVFDFVGSGGNIDSVEFFEELGHRVGCGGEGGVREVVDAVGEGVAFDFFVDGEGAVVLVIVEGHLGSVEAGFAADKIAELGVFDDHFGPEGVPREAKEEVALVGGDFYDYVGPAGKNLVGGRDGVVFEGGFDNGVQGIFGGEEVIHGTILA